MDEPKVIEYAHGDVEYFLNGRLHREDGPAVATRAGVEVWYRHGLRHREDGPAIVRPLSPYNYHSDYSLDYNNMRYEFWIDGQQLLPNDPTTILRFADWFAKYYSEK